ncbi:MAG: imidazole glycerol phosphate synthase subunit HisH [Kiritimatiellia bacterium]
MITIVDYKAGNLTSVRLAFEHLGVPVRITDDPAVVRASDRMVFPGVGAAASAMDTLRRAGLVEALREAAGRGAPFLGICLGTQIILERSEEDGGVPCIGLIKGGCRGFQFANPRIKIPQMGWNAVKRLRPHPVFEGIPDESEFYFVHSYYPDPADPAERLAETEYGGFSFASVLSRKNVVATQFHPEKSGRIGLQLLTNFARWNGQC